MTQHYDNMLTQHKITEHPLSYTNSQISGNCSTSAIARPQAAFLRDLDSRLASIQSVVACVDSPHAHIISSSQKKTMSGVRSLRNELREFVLENVEVFDDERVLGTGSYGSVQEVRLEQLDTE